MWYWYGAIVLFFAIKLYMDYSEKPIKLEPKKPVDPKPFTLKELSNYTSNPIYIAIKGKVYDVTSGKSFYGVDGPYGGLAGRDATFALAKMKTDPDECDTTLNDKEMQVLQDWILKFDSKYPVVGFIKE
eukprot:NODE_704_length_4578_cov_0.780978.p5 type:complete len:129 gc:universal NODE_704_length_4578_cov_0.780978:2776-3162(+)